MRATRPHSCGSLFCDCEYSTGSCIKLYSKINPTKPAPDKCKDAKKQIVKRDELNKQYDNYQKILLNQYYQSKPSASAFNKNSIPVNPKRKSNQVPNNRNRLSSDRISFSKTNAKKVSFGERNDNINTRGIKLSDTLRRSRKSDNNPRKSNTGSENKTTYIRLSTIWKTKDNFSAGDFINHLDPSHEPKKSIYLQNQPISFVELLNERNPKCSLFKIENFETIEDISSDEDQYSERGELFTNKMGNGVSNPSSSSNANKIKDLYTTATSELDSYKSKRSNSLDISKSTMDHRNLDYLRNLISILETELRERENFSGDLHSEVIALRREVKRRDEEIARLETEVHKLKMEPRDPLSSLGKVGQLLNSKKQGVSGESSTNGQTANDIQIQRYDKDFRSKQLIKAAIMDNDFLKNLDTLQVKEMVESMHQAEYKADSYVITEGEAGNDLFVSAEGEFQVIKDGKILAVMGPGKAFGELAILYNCTRTASIRALTPCKVWMLDRRVFQKIMMRTGLQRLEDNITFLRSVPLLKNMDSDLLAKIADVLEVEFYPAGHYIIREGAKGDSFFIISGGQVKVTRRIKDSTDTTECETLRVLKRGDYFGEQALIKEDCRTASVIALAPGVECLTLDRESFNKLIGDLSELHEKSYDDNHVLGRNAALGHSKIEKEYEDIQLNDLDVIATLGIGGFGRVELVTWNSDKSKTFALKCLKKQHIVSTQQQGHVYSEKIIMMQCRSPFICRLYKTFKDSKYVYMLLEACLGGEVWTILRERTCFDDNAASFITACVIEALEYLHTRGIVFRDLKPENLLLDNRGYVKLVDFGFSKHLGHSGCKTWTFCGTPEYVAPEIIKNRGHDRAVDYWALGILMHELLTGMPPFCVMNDPMQTYNMIINVGIDKIPFPKHVTRTAQSLIKALCKESPAERLGYQRGGIVDIKKHKWFQGFDWDGLRNQTLTPPIIPVIKGPTDTSNFDRYSAENDVPPDETSNWDCDF
ncbi:hypothetical protein M8J75_016458 [Diaphorina citri]|nr:hypothetical protein M8J75_016458 [Diaphorina citri]